MKSILIKSLYNIVRILIDSKIFKELYDVVEIYINIELPLTGEQKAAAVSVQMAEVMAELNKIGITISTSMLNMAQEIVYNYLKDKAS